MVILIVIAVAATMLKSTKAAEYTVGDNTGWTSAPPGGASFYSDWASNITFREGDILGEYQSIPSSYKTTFFSSIRIEHDIR